MHWLSPGAWGINWLVKMFFIIVHGCQNMASPVFIYRYGSCFLLLEITCRMLESLDMEFAFLVTRWNQIEKEGDDLGQHLSMVQFCYVMHWGFCYLRFVRLVWWQY